MDRRKKTELSSSSKKKKIEERPTPPAEERTPIKPCAPKAQSTPIEEKKESEESEDEPLLIFSQDLHEIQYDYNTPDKNGKKKNKKPFKRPNLKKRLENLQSNCTEEELQIAEEILGRGRRIIKKPEEELSGVLDVFKALEAKIMGINAKNTETQGSSSAVNEVSSENKALENDIQCLKAFVTQENKQCVNPSTVSEKCIQPKKISENYSTLFNDDEDDCILRCSQELEENLVEEKPVTACDKKKEEKFLKLRSGENPVFNENSSCLLSSANIDDGSAETNLSSDVLLVDMGVDEDSLTDTQGLKKKCVLPSSPAADTAMTKRTGEANETFSALLEDDADECMIQCSQEIEEKLIQNSKPSDTVNKIINETAVTLKQTKRYTQSNLSDKDSKLNLKDNLEPKLNVQNVRPICDRNLSFPSGGSNLKQQMFHTRAKSDSVISTVTSNGGIGFDDSFDMLLKDFSEEDISKLSQGVSVKKNVSTGAQKRLVKSSENNLKRNSLARSPRNRISVQSRNVDQFPNCKEAKSFKVGEANNKFSARENRPQYSFKFPSAMKNNNLTGNKVVQAANVHSSAAVKNSRNIPSAITGGHLTTERYNLVQKSSPQKYSPEEIERKRLEARKKLELKKLSMRKGRSNQFTL